MRHRVLGWRFIPDLDAVPVRVQAHGMRKDTGRVGRGVDDIVSERTSRWIQLSDESHPLRDLVVGTGSIAAHAQATDDVAVAVERYATSEEDCSTGNLTAVSLLTGREQQLGVEQVGLAKTTANGQAA